MSFIIQKNSDQYLMQLGGAWDWTSGKKSAKQFKDKGEAEEKANALRASLKNAKGISVKEI